ncbi:hypothetical protein PR202_gb28738 [Eleusine coracana subsp. coracana]|uniref:Zinc finger LSD1-type domain-containing protein n=1 Tax=Eleusine coracana subsp. coracana TaxID=191504 RepID=A0AAV5FVC3_ELECO|nr:hypothetical protein PR202_gb28738 [Eleusine coracana subsp. coracana]
MYPAGATSVCCAVCSTVTAVPAPGTEMAQLVCGGCHTLLMYIRGATSVQCSCCHTVNLAMEANQVAHVHCGNCRMLLMYQYGARSVKCAVCNFVTSVGVCIHYQRLNFEFKNKRDFTLPVHEVSISAAITVMQFKLHMIGNPFCSFTGLTWCRAEAKHLKLLELLIPPL